MKIKNILFKLLIILAIVSVDLLTKKLLFGCEFDVIPFLISVRAVYSLNTGGAWNFLGGHTWLLIAITIIFLIIFVFYDVFSKDKGKLYNISFCLIIGGTLGNFIDRIFLGGVRDFIYFSFWPSYPTFNMADSFLLVGLILFFIYFLFFKKEEMKK